MGAGIGFPGTYLCKESNFSTANKSNFSLHSTLIMGIGGHARRASSGGPFVKHIVYRKIIPVRAIGHCRGNQPVRMLTSCHAARFFSSFGIDIDIDRSFFSKRTEEHDCFVPLCSSRHVRHTLWMGWGGAMAWHAALTRRFRFESKSSQRFRGAFCRGESQTETVRKISTRETWTQNPKRKKECKL